LLERFGYDDPDAADLCDPGSGAPLVGVTGGPAAWPECAFEAPADPSELLQRAGDDPRSFTRCVRPSRHDAELWAASLLEVEAGKALGPFDKMESVQAAVGGSAVPAHRFGVKQSEKLRPCDNMSGEGDHVNSCFRSSRKLLLSDLDTFSLCALRLAGGTSSCRALRFWKKDHKSAYRQIPVAANHRRFAVFAQRHPDTGEIQYFVHLGLPFGASAAVYG